MLTVLEALCYKGFGAVDSSSLVHSVSNVPAVFLAAVSLKARRREDWSEASKGMDERFAAVGRRAGE